MPVCTIPLQLFGSYKRLENVTEQTQDEEEEESEDEEPPIIEMIYRRNCKDKTKLIVLPVLYFTFMVLAGVFSFYSISALIESYSYQVRSVRDVHVTSYTPVGIAMFLEDYGTFHDCSFKYNDDLAPPKGNFTPLLPGEVCDHKNITFWSKLVNANRTAMVFKGPSELKVSIALNFSVNTSRRNFGALEFMLLENWHSVNSPDVAGILARTEVKSPLYTVPAGFRTWIKMTYTVYSKVKGSGNSSEFTLSFGFSTYNDWNKILNQPTNVIYVLFEWKDDTYEYVTEILSTNLWNTLGSLAGIFVGLYKAGELCTAWIKRVRRERRKKLIKLSELEEQQKRLMEEYEERKREKEERKQTLRKEDFPRLSPLKESQRLSPMKAEPQRVTVTPHRDIPRRQQEEV